MDIQEAHRLALQLIEKHAPGKPVAFGFDRAKYRFGQTVHERYRDVITLSKPLTELNNEVEVRDTILHEIAHVLAGEDHDHDATWKRIAAEIGASPNAKTRNAITPKRRWVGICVTCGYEVPRDRLTARMRESSCSKCDRKWNPKFKFKWMRAT